MATGITFVGAGLLGTNGANSDTLSLAAPACTIGDLLIARVVSKNAVTYTKVGWTQISETQNGAFTLLVCYKIADATDASGFGSYNFVRDGAAQPSVGQAGAISAYHHADGVITKDTTNRSLSTNIASDNVDYATFDPASTNCLVIAIGAYADDQTTAGAIAGVNPTFTNRADNESSVGTDLSIFQYDGESDGAATGARVHSTTSTVDAVSIGVVFAIVPPVVPAAPTVASQPLRNRLTWAEDPSASITHYEIQRSVDGGAYATLTTCENMRQYQRHTDYGAAVPPLTVLNVFSDMDVVPTSTYTYKVCPMIGAVKSSTSAASAGVSPAAAPVWVVQPTLPTEPYSIVHPQSNLYLWWLIGGSYGGNGLAVTTTAQLGIDLTGRFNGTGYDYFKSHWLDPIIAENNGHLVNHVIAYPFGLPQYLITAAGPTCAPDSMPVGTFPDGTTVYVFGADALDVYQHGIANAGVRVLVNGTLEAMLLALKARGIHTMVYTFLPNVANGTKTDATYLGGAGVLHFLAGNASAICLDSASVCAPTNTLSGAADPCARIAALISSYGSLPYGEPLGSRGQQNSWLTGRPIGIVSTGSRTNITRTTPNSWTTEAEARGGHICIISIGGGIATNPSNATELYDLAMVELTAGRKVAISDGSVWMGSFTALQRQNLIEAARFKDPRDRHRTRRR